MENGFQNTYPESTAIVGMAQSVWDGNKEPARVNFSLSDKLKAGLKKLLEKDIESIFITDSDIRHIKKNHGQNEAKRGQIDITPADFVLIPLVMNDFNSAEQTEIDRLGNRKIIFTKNIDGTVYVAGVEKGNTKIRVITLWKKPGRVLNAGGNPSP
ncbi:hypothetical protein AGMMS50255_1250 [Spirochaetia bacterium]|nr:hypothetical protein AGMMS50255_1250 [Spirochaetia bacterium]